MKEFERIMKQVQKDKQRISKKYNVELSAIVHIGDFRYIVVKDGIEKIVY